MTSPAISSLLGKWVTDPADVRALEVYGRVVIQFEANGALVYSIRQADRAQEIFLTYYLDGDELVTNQPSAPRAERSRYQVTADGKLCLEQDGIVSRYVRLPWEDSS